MPAALAFVMAVVVCLLQAGPAAAGGLDRVRAAGVLRWGADIQGGEPYAFDDPNKPGQLVGFEVDLANALARSLGVARAEMVQNDWSTLVPALERGNFDVALNGLEARPALAERILLSRPYYLFTERLMVRRDAGAAPTADPATWKGRRIGTLSSSLAATMIEAAGGLPVLYEGVEEPYIDLAAGRTDGVLLDDIIASRYGAPKPGLRTVGDVGQGAYVVGVRRDDADLHAAIDRALAELVASGEVRRILARWNIDSDRQAALASAAPVAPPVAKAPARDITAQLWLFVHGALTTLLISAAAMALAIPLGLGLATARLFGGRPVRALATLYVEIVRGTPVLLQLFVLYYGLASVVALDAFTAAILGLGLNYAAYEAEVYRGGFQAVPRGQLEAAWALGMTTPMALRRVVVPQAMRFALPGVTNDFIALLKDSSLVSVISVVELTKRMSIVAVDRRDWIVPGVLCAVLYLAMSWPLSLLARRLEARMGGGAR